MSEPFLSEIKMFGFNYPPKGWAFCNGQLLPINQNQALFSLLGTMYGGNGQTTFALPDLRSRVPIHVDQNGTNYPQGSRAGEEFHTITVSEMPAHTHTGVSASSSSATEFSPIGGKALAVPASGAALYGSNNSENGAVQPQNLVSTTGGSQPHENRMPFAVVNFCIALQGIFPSRD